MLWRKTVSKDQMGQQLWLLCCDFADKFCMEFRPKLQAEGFLQDSSSDRVFMFEAMLLHLWVISLAFDEDRPVLDVLHNFAANWYATQNHGQTSGRLNERYASYNKAFYQDAELHAKGLSPQVLADTTLQCLLQNEKHGMDCVITDEVGLAIMNTYTAVKNCRAKFKTR